MSHRIEKLIVVGGGTAGWLSALYLQRALPKNLKISLVESKDVPCIGVGESTIPTLVETVKFLGIDETQFLRKTHGTFKGAIKYVNWEHPPGSQGRNSWWHPFFPRNKDLHLPYKDSFFPYLGQGYSLSHFWLHQKRNGKASDFDYSFFLNSLLCNENKLPKAIKGHSEEFRYAYHIDAGLVGDLFKDLARERGIEHIIGHVEKVNQDERGHIVSLGLKDGRQIDGDFFIDCTGFARLLGGKTLKGEFVSDKRSLFCDSAIALQVPNEPEKLGIRSFTTATALTSGWSWEVPLINRNGTGYVYCKDFISKEEAEIELRNHLGPTAKEAKAHYINFQIGKLKNLWQKNCLSVGLSGLFIEPLEATSIVFTELQLATFVNLFPAKDCSPYQIQKYNNILDRFYQEVRDFIILHYYLSRREDTPFWRAIQNETYIPDSLKMKIELQKENFMVLDDRLEFPLFTAQSYHCIFSGMNHLPKADYAVLDYVDDYKTGIEKIEKMQHEFEKILPQFPDHYQYLKEHIHH